MSLRSLRLSPRFRKYPRPAVHTLLRCELLEDRRLPATWFPVGPAPILNGNVPGHQPVTGRITGIAADPTDANVIYIASAGGGVWKTTDAGNNWTPLTDNQPTLVMGAIALAPSDPNVIYAGTGEADGPGVNFLSNYSPTEFYGRGVLKSTDGGQTWALLGNDVFNRRSIAKVVINPNNADVAYVAVGQPGFNGLTGNQGIWETTDGGQTWTNTTAASGISSDLAFTDLVIDPSNDQHLYAVAGDPAGSTDNGLYETTDGGQTWARNTGGGTFPNSRSVGRIALAISPTNPLRLYASITNGSALRRGQLLAMVRSDDGGASWTTLQRVPNYLGGQGDYDTTLIVDPSDPDRVYAGGQGADSGTTQPFGVIESTDAGQNWSGIAVGASGQDGPHNDHHAVAFDANGLLLDGNDAGIWRLDNPNVGQVHWTDLNNNLQITTFIGIALHPTDPTVAYGGSQDNGTEIYTGAPAWTQVLPHDGGNVRVDPVNPNIVYDYRYASGAVFERSDDGGYTWTQKMAGLGLNGNFFPPFVLDPSNPDRLVLGAVRVFETTDQGEHWVGLSSPNQSGWTSSAAIDSVAVAPSDADTLYASAGGHIFVTNNHGQTWMQRDVPGYADHFFDIKVDPNDAQTAYAVRGLFGGGHIFKTTDGGQNWTDISGNLPDLPAFVMVIGPGTLYLGTDAGVYETHNGGRRWKPLGRGMPSFQVKDLDLNTTYGILAAGTHGRGMWEIHVGGRLLRAGGGATVGQHQLEASLLVGAPPALPVRQGVSDTRNGILREEAPLPALQTAGVDGFFSRRLPVEEARESGRPANPAPEVGLDAPATESALDLFSA